MTTPAFDVSHHYTYVNGIRFHYVQAGTGKRLILLLHGFPEFWYSWRHQLGPLSQQFTVVAPDLRGYNLTDKPNWGYELDVLAQDVVGLIEALSFETAVVVGHDWGGVIAWATAISFPQRVERLVVLNAPHPSVFREVLRRSGEQRARSTYAMFFQLPFLPEALLRANNYALLAQTLRSSASDPSVFSDEDIQAYKTAMAQPGALTAALNYYRAAGRNGIRTPSNGDGMRVHMPTLLIWGEKDVALTKELTYNLELYVPDLRIHYIPAASHWVQHEAADEVNQAILEFFCDRSE